MSGNVLAVKCVFLGTPLTYLMRSIRSAFIVLFLTLLAYSSWAQTGQPDDGFNLFLLTLAIAFFSVVIGAILFGSLIVLLLLLAVFSLVSMGILSAGILVGWYRRSVAAGFKTVLMIVAIGGGTLCGAGAFWLINRNFDIHLRPLTAALTGAFSGLVGGLLLGLILFNIIRLFLNYCRKKLAF